MRLRRSAASVLAAVVAAGAMAGCGSAKPGPTVNPAVVAKQIRDDFTQRYSIAPPVVHCPSGESNTAGKTFSCSTAIDGQSLSVNVQVFKPDHVHFQPGSSVLSASRTEQAVERKFEPQLGTFTASCGSHPVLVVAVNATVTCTATAKGATRTFTVMAIDLASDIDITLQAPTTGPDSTTPVVTAPPTPGSTPGAGTLPGD